MRTVLVTGAGGLIGHAVAEALHRAGHGIRGVYRSTAAVPSTAPFPALTLDLTAPPGLGEAPPADFVVHCAAQLPLAFEGAEAERVARANRKMDDAVLAWARRAGAAVVFLSSSSVYGRDGAPWSEESPVDPMGPYAREKLRTEQLLPGSGLPWTALRISAPYGPAQRTRTVLTLFVERALADADLLVHGTGSRQQDFTAAGDVAGVVLRVVESGVSCGPLNVSGGTPITMRALAELVVASVPGTKSGVRLSGVPDPDEGYRAALRLAKARRLLDWEPRVSLGDGIAELAARKVTA